MCRRGYTGDNETMEPNMARKPTFKKADAAKFAKQLAADVAELFNVPAPEIEEDTAARDWEYRLGTVRVWTIAGTARMSVDVSATFAHLYFQFDDVARAKAAGLSDNGRLNQHSGKWNNWHAPDGEIELRHFREELLDDFRKVAQPNPDPAEVAAFEAKEAAEAAKWAAAREEFRASLSVS
jgi:hypothetical protein